MRFRSFHYSLDYVNSKPGHFILSENKKSTTRSFVNINQVLAQHPIAEKVTDQEMTVV